MKPATPISPFGSCWVWVRSAAWCCTSSIPTRPRSTAHDVSLSPAKLMGSCRARGQRPLWYIHQDRGRETCNTQGRVIFTPILTKPERLSRECMLSSVSSSIFMLSIHRASSATCGTAQSETNNPIEVIAATTCISAAGGTDRVMLVDLVSSSAPRLVGECMKCGYVEGLRIRTVGIV